jgi:hypothetical protein
MTLRIKSRPDLEKAAKEKGKLDEFFYQHCGKPITASKDAVVYNQWFQYGCYWSDWMLDEVKEEGKEKYYTKQLDIFENNGKFVGCTTDAKNATLIVNALNQYHVPDAGDKVDEQPLNYEITWSTQPHPLIGQKVKAWDFYTPSDSYEGVLLFIVPKPYSRGNGFIVGIPGSFNSWGYFTDISPLPSPVSITATIEGDTITHDGRMFREVKG